MTYRFTIPGPAVPQGRPRITTVNGYPRAFDPPKSKAYKEFVRHCVMEQWRDRLKKCASNLQNILLFGPISVVITEYREVPKAWSKKKRRMAIEGKLLPTKKADIDNVAKAILDAVKGQVWVDDAQVVDLAASKRYSDNPRVELEVTELECEAG